MRLRAAEQNGLKQCARVIGTHRGTGGRHRIRSPYSSLKDAVTHARSSFQRLIYSTLLTRCSRGIKAFRVSAHLGGQCRAASALQIHVLPDGAVTSTCMELQMSQTELMATGLPDLKKLLFPSSGGTFLSPQLFSSLLMVNSPGQGVSYSHSESLLVGGFCSCYCKNSKHERQNWQNKGLTKTRVTTISNSKLPK